MKTRVKEAFSEVQRYWEMGGVFEHLGTIFKLTSTNKYLASDAPHLRQNTSCGDSAPLTLGAPGARLPPLVAPGASGGTFVIQTYL